MKTFLISLSVLPFLAAVTAHAESAPGVQKPAIDTRLPLQYAAAAGGGSMAAAAAPMPVSNVYFKLHADIGITSYTTKISGLDPTALNGYSASTVVSGTTQRVYTSGATSNISSEDDLLEARGFPSRTYGEGSIGVNAASGNWYGDFYFRTALLGRSGTGAVNYTNQVGYRIEQVSPNTLVSTNNATSTVTALTDTNFYRNQFTATIGRAIMDNWSLYAGYRYSLMRNTVYNATTSTQVQTITPNAGAVSNVALTATTVTGVHTSLRTHGPAVGVGYAQAFGQNDEHVFTGGVSAAYSFASLNQSRTLNPNTLTNVVINGTATANPPATIAAENVVGVMGSGTARGFGVWGNIGYQFYLSDRLSVSLGGDGYWFGYGKVLTNAGGRDVGKLREISLSGRVGVNYLF
jgi:hypothetical protein